MTLTEISKIRLISQKISSTEFTTAKEIVSWMGAMQAQDYSMAKWAMGTRLLNSTDEQIERLIDKGEIIRTHVMRPTWHFVSAEDVYWMLELTAPQIKSAMKSRDRELELSERIYAKSNSIIEKALQKNKYLTGEVLKTELEKAKIATNNYRSGHIMLRAELDGIVCSGASKGNKRTYALLAERVSKKKTLTKEEALVKLAKKYFSSHCPATLNDFIWWSGLPVKDARSAIEMVKSDFIAEAIGADTYLLTNSFPKFHKDEPSVHLLPAYDEFLISYKDRSASLSLTYNKKAVSNNGIFYPVIVVNGIVTGSWKRTTKKDKVIIETTYFHPHTKAIRNLIEKNVDRLGKFLNKEIEIKE